MNPSDPNSLPADLETLYQAERTFRTAMDKIAGVPQPQALEAIGKALNETPAQSSDEERTIRLVCLSRVLRRLGGDKAIDLLIHILGSDSPEACVAAGTGLENIAYDHPDEICKRIEHAAKSLPADHRALCELPFIVLTVAEGDALRWIRPFLSLANPEAVAAAIEALVENGDPSAVAMLERFGNDTRTVEMEDESTGETTNLTLGELAQDAVQSLREIEKAMTSATAG